MKELIKQICGDIASLLFPGLRNSIATGEVVPQGALQKLISSTLIRKAATQGKHDLLRNQLSQYWKGGAGDAFYDKFADRFQTSFLGEHYVVVEALKKEVAKSNGAITQLYEMGCGDGQVLNHLSENLPGVTRFVGLDINENIITKNRETYRGKKLEFEAGDATERIAKHATPGMVLLSYGGVMEYLLESELVAMFKTLKSKTPVIVALVEPLYDEYDLTKETASRSSGLEHSFSHNHRHLLEKAGFEIVFQKETKVDFRWIMIVAKG